MSATTRPVSRLSQLDLNKVYAYADYLTWQFSDRIELIKGKIFEKSPAPSTAHQRIATSLTGLIWAHFQGKSCQVFSAPFDVRLPRTGKADDQIFTVVQPDLCVICDQSKLDERGCVGAPDLVVEILSPGNSSKEMKEKFEAYEEAGVREYWLVNLLDKVALVYVLDESGKYFGLPPVTEQDLLRSRIFPDLAVDLKTVFA
jgi:Uma2 family endonuclease